MITHAEAERLRERSTTRALVNDISGIERRIKALEAMRQPPPGAFRLIDISRSAYDALDAYGAPEHLEELIESCHAAHADLCERHRVAEIAETTQLMFRQHGAERAQTREYLRDLLGVR